MKLLVILFIFSSSFCLANSNHLIVEFNKQEFENIQTVESSIVADISEEEFLLVDCEFRVVVNNEDGTSTEYHITVHDVSWWNCKKMQLAAWWDRNF